MWPTSLVDDRVDVLWMDRFGTKSNSRVYPLEKIGINPES